MHAHLSPVLPRRRLDREFLATLLAAEGYVQDAPDWHHGTPTGDEPRLVIPMYDKAYPAKAAVLMGTRLLVATVPARRGGKATRWTAMASGTRSCAVMLAIWDEILEGTRKRRFRDWMLRVALPHAERVAQGLPRHVTRVEKHLGVDPNDVVSESRNWRAVNEGLPVELWKLANREY